MNRSLQTKATYKMLTIIDVGQHSMYLNPLLILKGLRKTVKNTARLTVPAPSNLTKKKIRNRRKIQPEIDNKRAIMCCGHRCNAADFN